MEDITKLMSVYQLICKGIIAKQGELKDYTVLNQYENFKDIMSEEDFKIILNEKQRRKNKRSRANTKIYEMIRFKKIAKSLNVKLVFITMTLNEKYINREDRTKAKLIDSWIKKHFIRAIVNKDFGDKTEREHYHAIGITTEEIEPIYLENGTPKKSKKGYPLLELTEKNYILGHEPTIQIIDIDDITKLKDYLLKLNNHSNKTSAKSRLRDIKGIKWEYFEIQYTTKRKEKDKRKKANKYIKNATYDTLNKRSVSRSDEMIVLSDEEIIELFSN